MRNHILIILLAISFFSCMDKIVSQPKAIKGVLNLTEWDYRNKAITLDGEWEFYPNEFVDLNGFNKVVTSKKKYISVPGIWNENLGSRFGFATYRLTVLLPSIQDARFVFKLAEMGTAYVMFVNGKKIASNGVIGKSKEQSIPQFLPLVSNEIELKSKIEIVCYISNYHNRDGGLWYSILLGREQIIRDIRERKMLNSLFIYGCLFTMVLYHVAIFLIRKKDKSALVFSLFCLAVVSHLLVFDEKFLNQIFTENSFLILNKIEYLSYYLAMPLFSHFLYLVFSEDFRKNIMQGIWFVALLFSSVVLLTGSEIYTFTIPFYHIFTLFAMLYFLFVFYLAVKLKREGAKIIFFGTVIFFVGILNDILHSLTLIRTMFIFPQGLMVFLFSHSIVISIRFTSALSQVEKLSDSLVKINIGLEEKVIQRTKEFKLEKENAEEANKIKDKFVSIVSHDLRSPLQGVLNLLEILNNPKIQKTKKDQKKFLTICLESIKFSLSMIRQLLDLSRIETGNLKIHKEKFLFNEFMQNIINELKPFYLIKNISIIMKEVENKEIFVDKNLFQQVISNLLINAIKYSKINQTIEIECSKNSKNSFIRIKDHGIGMTKTQLNNIRSSNLMESSLGTSGETGSGMGIYICKYIIQAHNGKLQFKSIKEKGTNVTIILPLK